MVTFSALLAIAPHDSCRLGLQAKRHAPLGEDELGRRMREHL